MKPGLRYRLPPEPPEPERERLLRELAEFLEARRRLDLEGAKLFNAIARLGIHLHEGASSVAQLAEEGGMTAASARELEHLGRALYHHPSIEEDIAKARIPVANAGVLGQVDIEDDFLREGDDWAAWARTMRPREYMRRFHERRDEVRQGRPVKALTVFLTHQGHHDFEEARKFASRSAQAVLTGGQTVVVLVDEYLDRHDPSRKTGAPRRCADTAQVPAATVSEPTTGPAASADAGTAQVAGASADAGTPADAGAHASRGAAEDPGGPIGPDASPGSAGPEAGGEASRSRYIPAEVRRAVLRRKWNQCAVPYCGKDMFLHFSHRNAHRDGGSREADNLDLLCGWHHMLYEQGVIRIEGTSDDPVFRTKTGRMIGERGCDGDFLYAQTPEEKAEEEARRRRNDEVREVRATITAMDAESRAWIAKSMGVFSAPTAGDAATGVAAGPPSDSLASPKDVPDDDDVPLDAFYPRLGEGFGIWPVR